VPKIQDAGKDFRGEEDKETLFQRESARFGLTVSGNRLAKNGKVRVGV